MATVIRYFSAALVAILFSAGGLYSQPVDDLPYLLMKTLYELASEPATISDIDDVYNFTSNQKCSAVADEDHSRIWDTNVDRLTKVFPGKGPLFPGRTEERIILYSGRHDAMIFDNWDKLHVSSGADSLIVHVDYIHHMLSTPYTMYLRKSGEIIAFYVTLTENNPEKRTHAYGYCYRETSSE